MFMKVLAIFALIAFGLAMFRELRNAYRELRIYYYESSTFGQFYLFVAPIACALLGYTVIRALLGFYFGIDIGD